MPKNMIICFFTFRSLETQQGSFMTKKSIPCTMLMFKNHFSTRRVDMSKKQSALICQIVTAVHVWSWSRLASDLKAACSSFSETVGGHPPSSEMSQHTNSVTSPCCALTENIQTPAFFKDSYVQLFIFSFFLLWHV